MLDLGTLGGADSYGYAVNGHGHVVGLSYVPPEVSNNSHAFLYTAASGMVDLNDLIDPLSGWELLDADDINDAGQMTGQGLINDEYHAFLLTPIPQLSGDLTGDGAVDAADLAQWQGDFGANDDSDADNDGDSDGTDFLIWQRHLGSGVPAVGPSAAVPEPATKVMLLVAAAGYCLRSRRSA
jgi:probable HAF family extracellular repeat protein